MLSTNSQVRDIQNLPLLSGEGDDFIISFETNQKQKKSKDNSFFDIRERSTLNFTWLSLKEGLPSSFCFGDFFICSMVCRMFLGANEDINLVASTGYYGAFYSILMQAFNFGAIEVQGIFGSQANGKSDPALMNKLFRQSILTGMIFFVVFACIPAYFLDFVFPLLGVERDLFHVVKLLIWWSIPAMFIRVLNDNFKTFIQN